MTDAGPDGFRLSAVVRPAMNEDAIGSVRSQRFEHRHRSIAAAIVHETEAAAG